MTFYVFLKRHFKKCKKSFFGNLEKNEKYVFSDTAVCMEIQSSKYKQISLTKRRHLLGAETAKCKDINVEDGCIPHDNE